MFSLRTTLTLLALPALAAAGNVCLGVFAVAGLGDAPPDVYYVAFAAGSPCDESRSAMLTDTLNENWCSISNRAPQFDMCGSTATIFNAGEPIGDDADFNDCGAKLSINGEEFDGEVLEELAEDNPCSATCNNGIAFGNIGGLRHYVDVPMCD
ncbi:hypothetical protein FOQG_15371 [Fusarium oxysporum f. sp. raphani 54005]|uniref:Uncharacterized protein n=10 Tax=Fusarium oxysporum species complex TaxID=171631 RepID=A0A2H3TQY7_FUSOX|nr:uncharacterized protein FOIG_08511 [Fusarium odoratissimum NRRL 54006]EGU78916.1 hypothetical protein FOXB_10574 [Fusarium oxysporum f. sp. conglutinans Fo5176]EMT71609.1 hypothetical protein FOC4_g10010120 [Fusarium odoratissimum]EXA29782.1 hypothetical protein FOVG_18765 [Fusarium oxysporum f. sp. pisi HDV247]EXK80094.1 hypothetical protein FOQG_15371 [Fusarium oxysporum f. sp. raphani 54005]EXL70134.1 hypothetical protein FOPG_14024 [Fusarium oxysporum f. sp. conglutinans race 2 54008]K